MGTSIVVWDKQLKGGQQSAAGYELRRYTALTDRSKAHLTVVQPMVLVWAAGTASVPCPVTGLGARRSRMVDGRKYQAAHFEGSVAATGAGLRLHTAARLYEIPPGAAVATFPPPLVGRPLELVAMVLDVADVLVTPDHLIGQRTIRPR